MTSNLNGISLNKGESVWPKKKTASNFVNRWRCKSQIRSREVPDTQGSVHIHSDTGRKRVNATVVEDVATADLPVREIFALEFLARMEEHNEWLWKILWSYEAHFHPSGYVNTHNCRICSTENLLATQLVPHQR
ncbi:DUF4817 domain-containing protein [Trichonephila clavipes]|nr:DUF4817 domain-containing protein [Trichonephila clavipes]